MQKLTISAKDLKKVITNMYPTLRYGRDYTAIKYSDNEDILLEWNTTQYPEPSMSEIELALPNILQEEAEQDSAKAAQKAALLNRLGITEDEAKLLLA
jgi:hypothetical protein